MRRGCGIGGLGGEGFGVGGVGAVAEPGHGCGVLGNGGERKERGANF